MEEAAMIASSCLFRSFVTGAAIGFVMLVSPCAFAGAPAPTPVSSGPHPEHQVANLGDVKLEGGEVLKDFKVSYVTHGKLNKAKSNAILVMHMFLSDHHAHDYLIGPGKALDPDKYFVISTDMLGCSALAQNVTTGATNSGLKMDFPFFTVRDSVNVEYRFLKEYLGLEHVLAVMGPSIGAMKSYQFAVSYPNFISAAIPIAGSPVTGPRARWLTTSMMDIIALDPGWQGGNYETNPLTGLAVAARVFAPYIFTERWYAQNVRTAEQRRELQKIWHGLFFQDARDVYYDLRMWATFNVGDTPGFGGDAGAALRSIKARVLLLSMKDDQLISSEEIAMTKSAIPNVVHVEVNAAGHAGCCGGDPEANKVIDREIARFLATLK
jgi:homoserine O-acetyltransferase